VPNISFYATQQDLSVIVGHFNDDEDVAYLVPDGKNRWKAVLTMETLQPGLTVLWHIPAGELFYTEGTSDELHRVTDPWSGWEMPKSIGGREQAPYFPTEVQTRLYEFQFRPFSQRNSAEIGLSAMGWLGNHYSVIGIKADPITEKHWQKNKRWFNKMAKVGKRVEASNDVRLNAWTFPDALLQKESGESFAVNPW